MITKVFLVFLLVLAGFFLYRIYSLFFLGPVFLFFAVLVLILLITVYVVFRLYRHQIRWWPAVLAAGSVILVVTGSFGGYQLAQIVHWAGKNPDRYEHGEIVAGTVEGRARILPQLVKRDSYQTFTLTYQVGPEGVAEGGRIIVRPGKVVALEQENRLFQNVLLEGWEHPLQVRRPEEQGYVSVRAPQGVTVNLSKPAAPPAEDWLMEAFLQDLVFSHPDESGRFLLNLARHYEVHLEVVGGSLKPGDEIELVLGDTAGGGPGWLMPAVDSELDFVFYVDPTGEGRYRMGTGWTGFEVGGKETASLEVVAPSMPPLNKKFSFLVRAVDRDGFLSLLHQGGIIMESQEGVEFATGSYSFSPEDRGVAHFCACITEPGIYRLAVLDVESKRRYVSNPVVVERHTGKNLFWGNLHQYTVLSGEVNRDPQEVLEDNLQVEGLDFAAISMRDRLQCPGSITDQQVWNFLNNITERYNEPGLFVTFPGYEWSSPEAGDRNIYRLEENGDPVLRRSAGTAIELRREPGKSGYLVLPHSTARRSQQVDRDYEWGSLNRGQVRLAEIYSSYGSCEQGNAKEVRDHPSSRYTGVKRTSFLRAPEGNGFSYIREALAEGCRFGFTAGGDRRWRDSYPPGLLAVYADELSREALFEALWERRTYATTGSRIVVEFTINGYPMGSEFSTGEPRINLSWSVTGTAPLKGVELWKHTASNGYKLFYTEGRNQYHLQRDSVHSFNEDAFYYLKVIQVDGHQAWTSPIWVDKQ